MTAAIASFLLALSTNLDNLAVGVTYGLKKLKVGWRANLTIAVLSGISTLVAMSVGDAIEDFLSVQTASHLGGTILMAIGLWGMYTAWQKNRSETPPATKMNLKQAWILGLALTATNFGTGVGAGITELDINLTSALSFGSSLVTIGGGYLLGKQLDIGLSRRQLELLCGLLLTVLGAYNYFALF